MDYVYVTPFGWVFALLLLLVAMRARAWLPGLVLGSAVFQAAAIANIPMTGGIYGISPYMTAAAVAGLVFLARVRSGEPPRSDRHLRLPAALLMTYGAIALLGAFVLPRVFAGLPIQPLLGPNGYVLKVFPPLHWGLSHLAQAVHLCAHLSVALYLWQAMGRTDWAPRKTLGAFGLAVLIAAAASLHDRLALLWDWPRMAGFWMSNLGYSLVDHVPVALANPSHATSGGPRVFLFDRISSPFSEPSYGSAFFAATFAGFLAWALLSHTRSWTAGALALISAVAMLNTVGSTGWVAGTCALVVIVLWAAVRSVSHRQRLKTGASLAMRLGVALCAVGLVFAALWQSPSGKMFAATTQIFIINKTTDLKRNARYLSDVRALELTRQTHGLGTGLGSNRSSSFITSLLSNTGVPGALAFLGMVASLLWRYVRSPLLSGPQYFASAALATAMLAVALSIPDLNLPFLWAFVFLAFVFCPGPPTGQSTTEGAA